MLREVLVHLEHRHLVLAEDLAKLVVGQNFAFVFRVLQVMGLDVFPDLAHHLAAREGSLPDHLGQLSGRLEWLLKRIRRLSSGRGWGGRVGGLGSGFRGSLRGGLVCGIVSSSTNGVPLSFTPIAAATSLRRGDVS